MLSLLIAPFKRVAVRTLIVLIALVFVAHVSLETLLSDYLATLPDLIDDLVDSSLLVVALCPALYLLVYRPLALRIAAQEQTEVALRASEERYRQIVTTANEGVWAVDAENKTSFVNGKMAALMGYAADEMLGKPVFDFVDPEVRSAQRSIMGRRRQGVTEQYDLLLRRKDGTPLWAIVSAVPLYDTAGCYVGGLAMLTDITERKRLEEELACRYDEARHLADHDPVTGLLNHRAIHARLEQEVKRAQRHGRPLSVMVTDLDGFKLFNDTYGHPAGDTVLQEIAAVLKGNARESDLLGRYGGDEFTAILPDTDAEGALALAERFRAALHEHPYRTPDGLSVPLHMSFGVATYPEDGCEPHGLIGCADANLYESKQWGGDTITSSETSRYAGDVKVSAFGVLEGLVTAVDRKDHYTRTHSEQVTDYAISIAQALGLSEESQRTLRIAGLLHDVGKIGVPDRVLRKPGRLDEEEFAIIQQHVTLGELIINEVPNVADVIAAVSSHHERMDGLGYPRGLKDGQIPLLGRIMAVADAYSAMTTDRPYRQGMRPEEAKAELLRVAGTQLDPDMVRVFLRVLNEGAQSRAEAAGTHVA